MNALLTHARRTETYPADQRLPDAQHPTHADLLFAAQLTQLLALELSSDALSANHILQLGVRATVGALMSDMTLSSSAEPLEVLMSQSTEVILLLPNPTHLKPMHCFYF